MTGQVSIYDDALFLVLSGHTDVALTLVECNDHWRSPIGVDHGIFPKDCIVLSN